MVVRGSERDPVVGGGSDNLVVTLGPLVWHGIRRTSAYDSCQGD